MSSGPPREVARRRFAVRGRVQGVGFRPAVYRLAAELGLGGVVGNDSQGAFIEVEGPAAALAAFRARLPAALPELAAVSEWRETALAPRGETALRIAASVTEPTQAAEISPDLSLCADCRRELLDPANRRYRYPFINCTNCGPRYAIVRAIPYDRPNTTMAAFTMCAACRREYEDPGDRRFHAQPNACPACGPRLWFADAAGGEVAGDAVALAQARLRDGALVAVKGLGGFHLACRADDAAAVGRLRERKQREAKPLAVMVASLAAARQLVVLDADAAALLESWRAPIVLAPRQPAAAVADAVAPGLDTLGIMLPYTPLHVLLLAGGPGPLVLTSANPTAEPLCADNAEAVARLGGIADGFLLHDRDIERRVDDSVVAVATVAGRPALVPVRRSRGYVPEPIRVPRPAPRPVLALGGDLKSVVCLLQGDQAVLSEHLGELGNPAAFRNFAGAIDRLQALLRVAPAVVACDRHPDYVSARHARRLALPLVEVQHHHAHLVSGMAENGLTGDVLGLAADGTGYGDDGQVWGCELLAGDARRCRRLGHLRYFPLVGGDAAALETWRPGVSLLRAAFGAEWRAYLPAAPLPDAAALEALVTRLESGRALLLTSSLGRLFDGVAFILGVTARNRFEADAARQLEALAAAGADEPVGNAADVVTADGISLDPRLLVRDLAAGRQAGQPLAVLAALFHQRLAGMLTAGVRQAADATGLRRVVLSGGCFLNRRLLRMLSAALADAGLEVYTHRRLPPGDGCLALGQAVIAAAQDEATNDVSGSSR